MQILSPGLRTLDLYKDNDNEDEPSTVDDIVKNVIEEINSADSAPNKLTYNVGKLNLEVLKKEQQWDRFCKSKVRDMKKKSDPNFQLDHNSILRKVIKLKYTIETAIVVPRKLTIHYHYRIPQCQRKPRHAEWST